MKFLAAAALSAAIAAGAMTATLPATASASTPRVGGACSQSEASSTRQAADGTRVVCVYLSSGRYQWQRLSNPTPRG